MPLIKKQRQDGTMLLRTSRGEANLVSRYTATYVYRNMRDKDPKISDMRFAAKLLSVALLQSRTHFVLPILLIFVQT